jgi:hypothetical protein
VSSGYQAREGFACRFEPRPQSASLAVAQNARKQARTADIMLRFLSALAGTSLLLIGSTAGAHERCACHEVVLNGQLNMAGFDGGVGDRFGASDDGYTSTYAYMSGRSFTRSSAFAFARASAHASAHVGGHGHR